MAACPAPYFSARIFRTFAEMTEAVAANDPGQLRYYGGKSLISQSHGQSLLSYFGARYQLRGTAFPRRARNGALASEPDRAPPLAPRLGRTGCAVPDRYPLSHPARLPGGNALQPRFSPIQAIAYEETEHYQLCHEFMAAPQAYLASIQ